MMTAISNIDNDMALLTKSIAQSFSEFGSDEKILEVQETIQRIQRKGYKIHMETNLHENRKYLFKTAILDLNQYLRLNDNTPDISRINRFLTVEKKNAIEFGNYECASIVTHIEKKIRAFEPSMKHRQEIIKLFELLPPYKLMKQHIEYINNTIEITIITAFEPYLCEMKKLF